MQVPTLILQMAIDMARTAQECEQIKRIVGGMTAHVEGLADKAASSLKKMAAGLLAAISVAAIKSFVTDVVAATAALDDMAEKTGATVAGLSQIRSVAKVAGQDMGGVEAAMIKLAKAMSEADDKTKGVGAAFNYLGISAKDSQGKLKSTDVMLMDIAKSMDRFADGPGKTALAIALLGKNGAQLIPLLKDMADESERLANMTDEERKRIEESVAVADAYEKNLNRLARAKNAMWKQIVVELTPALDSLAKFFLELTSKTGSWREHVDQLAKDGSIRKWANGAIMWVAQFMDTFAESMRSMEIWGTRSSVVLNSLLQHLARLATAGIENPISKSLAKTGEELKKHLAQLEKEAATAQGYYAKIMGRIIDTPSTPEAKKPQADPPNLEAQKKAHDERLALILKEMDALRQRGALERALAEANYAVTKDLRDREMNDYKAQFDLREISERELIEKQNALRELQAQENLARIQREREQAVNIATEMYAQLARITGADEASIKARAEAEKKIAAQQGEIVKLLGQEQIAAEAVTNERQKSADAVELYRQRIMDAVRASTRGNEDIMRAAQGQVAMERLQLSLIGATNVQRDVEITKMQYLLKLEEERVRHERAMTDLRDQKKAPELVAAEEQHHRAIVQSLTMQRDLQLEIIPLAEQQTKHVENLRNAWNAIDSTAFDVFSSILNKGEDTWKKLANTLKQTLIKMLYEMTVQRWAVQIFANVTGQVGANVAGQAAGQTLGQAGSLLGSGSTLASGATAAWGWLTGGSSAAATSGVTGIATAAGAGIAGASSGALIGGGATLTGGMLGVDAAIMGATAAAGTAAAGAGTAAAGAAAAGTAASGVAAAAIPVIGWIVAIAALAYSIFAANEEPSPVRAGLSRTRPFEDDTPGTQTPFGRIGFGDSSTQQFSGQVGQAFTAAIGQLLDLGAAQLSPQAIDRVTQVINDTILMSAEGTYTTEDFLNTFGPDMARQLLDPMLQEIDPYAAELVDKFKGPLDQFLLFVGDILTVTGALQEKGEEFERLFGEAITLEGLDAVRREGESFTATLNRVAAEFAVTNQIADMMGQSQQEVWGSVGLASLEAREQLIQFAGGMDKFRGSLSSYYQNYYSEAERTAATGKQLGEAFQSLGVEMPTSLQGFRDLMEQQDLTTEAGRRQYASLLELQGVFHDYTRATNQATEATRQATEAQRQAREQRTQGLRDQLVEADIDLMRAEGREYEALMYARSVAIAGMDNEQIAYYDMIQTRRAQATAARTQRDLETQLFNLTHNSNQVRARERQLRMQELELEEVRAGKIPGTLTGIQAQIDAAEDLNRTMEEFGVTADKISDILERGISGEISGEEMGRELGEMIVNGIRQGLISRAADAITEDLMNQFLEPMFAAIQNGSSVTAAVEVAINAGAIAAITANAQAMVQGLERLMKDPAFIAAMRQVADAFIRFGRAVGGAGPGGTAGADGPTGPGFQPASPYGTIAYSGAGGPDAPPFPGAIWVPEGGMPGGGYWRVTVLLSTGQPVEPGTDTGTTIMSPEQVLARKLEMLARIYELQGDTVKALAIQEQQRAIALAELRKSDPSGVLATLQAQLWGLEDAAEAAAKAAALLDQRLEMEARVAELSGDKAWAAAIKYQQQQIALAKLDPSLRALQTRLWELEAAAEAAAKAEEFRKTKMGLQIQLLRQLGLEEQAVALEHAEIIRDINTQYGAGSVQALELIAIYEQLWAAQGDLVSSGSSWVKSLQDWRKALLLSDQLSPLTASQRYAEARRQFEEISALAKAGDKSARDKYTGAADEVLRQAAAMYGTASPAYMALFQSIIAQTEALEALGAGPTAPATLTDISTILTGGQNGQKERDETQIAETKALKAEVIALRTALETSQARTATAVEKGADKTVAKLEEVRDTIAEEGRADRNQKVYG